MPTGDPEDEAAHKERMGLLPSRDKPKEDEPKAYKRGRWSDLIDRYADKAGVDRAWMHRVMKIESGGDPNNTTGSYKGLYQLSESEFRKHGGTGSIYDPEQNVAAAANMFAKQKAAFKEKFGREAKPIDMYMIHQQGAAGHAAHVGNPEGRAWENIRKYYKSDEVAKAAVWGNIPDRDKAKYGSVENVTSAQFVNEVWAPRVEGGDAEMGGAVMAHGRPVGGRKGGRSLAEDKAVDSAVDTKAKTILGEEADPVKAAYADFQVPDIAGGFSGSIKSRALS
jgi:Transglycosylase SLT domain